MKKFYLVLAALFVMLATLPQGLVAAADPTVAATGDWIPVLLYNFVFPFITALLMGLAALVLNWLRKKFRLEANEKQDEAILAAARRGIALAEEKAAAYAKVAGQKTLAGHQKLDIAIGHIVSAVPQVSPSYADQVVHSLLAKIPGVGATGAETVQ